MKSFNLQDRRQKILATCLLTFALVLFVPLIAAAQNLGGAPATTRRAGPDGGPARRRIPEPGQLDRQRDRASGGRAVRGHGGRQLHARPRRGPLGHRGRWPAPGFGPHTIDRILVPQGTAGVQ